MKKNLLMIMMFAAAVCFGAETIQFVPNGNFTKLNANNTAQYWWAQGKMDANSGADKEVIPPDYKGNSYRITGGLQCVNTLAVTPGKAYSVSCRIKMDGVKTPARLQLIWMGKDKRELLIDNPSAPGKKMWSHKWVWKRGTADWQELKIASFTAPENAKYARIRIGKDKASAGTVYYADVRMEECTAK